MRVNGPAQGNDTTNASHPPERSVHPRLQGIPGLTGIAKLVESRGTSGAYQGIPTRQTHTHHTPHISRVAAVRSLPAAQSQSVDTGDKMNDPLGAGKSALARRRGARVTLVGNGPVHDGIDGLVIMLLHTNAAWTPSPRTQTHRHTRKRWPGDASAAAVDATYFMTRKEGVHPILAKQRLQVQSGNLHLAAAWHASRRQEPWGPVRHHTDIHNTRAHTAFEGARVLPVGLVKPILPQLRGLSCHGHAATV
jgi:hypothetical protein